MKNDKLGEVIEALLQRIAPALTEQYAASLIQFIKFGIVGLSNTAISYLLNVGVLLVLRDAGLSWDYIAGNVIAFLLSVLWSFYWNNKYVFAQDGGAERVWWKALLKTYLCYGFTGILLNNVLSWIWITKLGISKFAAPLINLIISVPLNFMLNKLWAFQS